MQGLGSHCGAVTFADERLWSEVMAICVLFVAILGTVSFKTYGDCAEAAS
jgi:hypothetical protein